MTKAEQLAAKVRRGKEALEKQRRELAQDEANLREATRKATDKRRYEVGALAEAAGLLGWSNDELAGVFAALATLRGADHPAFLVEALQIIRERRDVAQNGVAESATRVSAAH